jgi:hypothetical protein
MYIISVTWLAQGRYTKFKNFHNDMYILILSHPIQRNELTSKSNRPLNVCSKTELYVVNDF